ncbi:MAG: hypothetical protein LBM98_12210 [Oscillospiraceae bacterium]|nr:hypothetical protein [Oscillospiraceae bacterium]
MPMYHTILRQPWIASPHTDLRNSTMGAFRRPRRTGFAKTVRRRAHHGRVSEHLIIT